MDLPLKVGSPNITTWGVLFLLLPFQGCDECAIKNRPAEPARSGRFPELPEVFRGQVLEDPDVVLEDEPVFIIWRPRRRVSTRRSSGARSPNALLPLAFLGEGPLLK